MAAGATPKQVGTDQGVKAVGDWEDVKPVGDWEDVSGSTPPKQPPRSWGQSALEFGKGAVKGAFSTLSHLAELEGSAPGIWGSGQFSQDDLKAMPPEARKNAEAMGRMAGEQSKWTEQKRTPNNTPQKLGFQAEQTAEYFIPVADAILPEAKAGAGLVRRIATTAGRDALSAGTIGTAQTGDHREGARQAVFAGVTGPAVSEFSRAMSPIMKKSAQRLYERFITPGGGTGKNKVVAQEAAEELIRRGHFELTRGGFTRRVEQNVMDAGKEIEAAEDKMLDSLGYSPTGRAEFNIRQEHYTEPGGPTITVDPIDTTPRGGPPAVRTQEVARRGQEVSRPITDRTGPSQTRSRWRVDTTWETARGLIDLNPVLRKLEAEQRSHYVGGRIVPGYQNIVRERQRLMSMLRSIQTPNGRARADQVVKLRRDWDRLVNYQKNPNAPTLPGIRDTYKDAADSLRHEISEQIPGMREANEKYHFWTGLNTAIKDTDDRIVGHRPLGAIGAGMSAVAGLEGYREGGAEKALMYAMAMGALSKAVDSGFNLTGSAITLDRLANAFKTRRWDVVVNQLAAAASPVARSGETATRK